MSRCLEIRTYTLQGGSRERFHRLFVDEALPMLNRWKVDVISYGPSPHDEESYYLMRSYASLEDRAHSQDAFYGSAEWKAGPREGIVALIQHSISVVLELDEATLEGLRRTRPS
ncbi:MAG TPA: NIPSNAP family protein [Candidatus Eisenbacteria bacterium]|nr:NIPSNAP family protein [Candidatus Eisenbacteria bacterium]